MKPPALPVVLARTMALALALAPMYAAAALRVVIIEGLGGEPTYTQQFDAEAHAVLVASRTLTAAQNIRLLAGSQATRATILGYFHSLTGALSGGDRLIVYLIGHGSYDGRQYKFNIPGPDLTDRDIGAMLDRLQAQQLVVATGSASGALLTQLSKPHRVLITGTRNGDEKNVTRFGIEFAAALSAPSADTDKNEAISAQEAYDFAVRGVQDYFRHEALLASEHPVLQGEGGGRFTVAALKPVAAAAVTAAAGSAAAPVTALTRRRDELNQRIAALEQRKASLPGAQYSVQLDPLLLELAQVQEQIDQGAKGARASGAGDEHAPH